MYILKKSIINAKLNQQKVLLRVDYNVDTDEDQQIINNRRITDSLPTIEHLLDNDCSIIIISHRGRPQVNNQKGDSLLPVCDHLSSLLNQEVMFFDNFLDQDQATQLNQLKPGQIAMLENLRYHSGEAKNDYGFAQNLAKLADIYVNNAFGSSHRAHASIVALPQLLPSYIGLLFAKEVEILNQIIIRPQQPMVVIIGGDKANIKINMILNLLKKSSSILLGGTIANTFLKAQGYTIGQSEFAYEMIETVKKIIWKASIVGTDILLPNDGVLESGEIVNIQEIKQTNAIYDIGPETRDKFDQVIQKAKTIVWNGPMGVFEKSQFRAGSTSVLNSIIQNTEALSIVGGGHTLNFLSNYSQQNKLDQISHISTGGGAMLEYIQNNNLPGIEVMLS